MSKDVGASGDSDSQVVISGDKWWQWHGVELAFTDCHRGRRQRPSPGYRGGAGGGGQPSGGRRSRRGAASDLSGRRATCGVRGRSYEGEETGRQRRATTIGGRGD
jgi:hypothetical protein